MSQAVLHAQARKFRTSFPDVRPGHTIRIRQKVQEGGKERIQKFEGLVIALHRGKCHTDSTVTVRKMVEGVGVEKIFPLCSPTVAGVDVVKIASVRRAKLFFLRKRKGQAARLNERFTTRDEFSAAVGEADKDDKEDKKDQEEL